MELPDDVRDCLDQGVDFLIQVQKDPNANSIQKCICILETIATRLRGLNVDS
jgi:hypothetical protein